MIIFLAGVAAYAARRCSIFAVSQANRPIVHLWMMGVVKHRRAPSAAGTHIQGVIWMCMAWDRENSHGAVYDFVLGASDRCMSSDQPVQDFSHLASDSLQSIKV